MENEGQDDVGENPAQNLDLEPGTTKPQKGEMD